MTSKISPPRIDRRKANDLLRSLREMAPHYTAEWPGKDDDDPGVALLKIFAFISEGVIARLNRAPERNFLAFLDMLGIRLLQARPAYAPIKFLVANGTEFPFLVQKGTQVSAPPTEQHPIDLPFETLSNLLAVPSTLVSLTAVDPEQDSIYITPPGFLELKQAATKVPPLVVTAFSSAGSNSLQVDPPDQVKKGDFLRIDQTVTERIGPDRCVPLVEVAEQRQSEHLDVEDTKGSLITVTDPLTRDYVEGTQVRKVTQFELFEGKNRQKHILFLGHEKYFATKSEAQFTLEVQHSPGISSNLQPLSIVWEFFGKVDALKDQEETWHEFQVDADGTGGFSRNGQILLRKPAGEITETKVNGQKSRWIRARLVDPLPASPPPNVPRIEAITFSVSSRGTDLAPDNAFSNDTPLTTDVSFFPFGTEPRIFDRFSIASEEAFSKPGADIELTFSLDTTELLAAPSAFHDGTRLRVFSRAVAGKLLEFQIKPDAVDIERHGNPLDKPIVANGPTPGVVNLRAGSTPAVVTSPSGRIAVFAPADDGKIYVRDIPPLANAKREWKSLPITPGALQFNPAAVEIGNVWHVFVVADSQLYKQELPPNVVDSTQENTDIGSNWFPILDSPEIDSSPFVLADGASPAVFVTDVDGRAHMLRGSAWTALNANVKAKKNARPFARVAGTDFRVFLRNTTDQIVAFDSSGGSPRNLDKPAVGTASNPYGSPDGVDIFVRGADGHLFSTTDVAVNVWVDNKTTQNLKLNGDPFVVKYLSGSVSVLSTSTQNKLLELRIEGAPLTQGNLDAGPRSIVFLKDVPTPAGTYYIHITDGPGSRPNTDVVRRIQDATEKFVVLDLPLLDEPPTADTQYDLLREEASGAIAGATADKLTIEAADVAGIQIGDCIFTEGQLRTIDQAPIGNDVHISVPWDLPLPSTTYLILRIDAPTQGDKATRPSNLRAVLPASAQAADNFYNGNFLRIKTGPGEGPVGRRIDDYFNNTNNVVLQSPFLDSPTAGSFFVITTTSEGQAWFVYEDKSQPDVRPELSWEYWNGKGWLALVLIKDETRNLLVDGAINFILPDDLQKTEVAGQENFWIRARIVGGDYGRELLSVDPKTGQVKIEKDPIRPARINKLRIGYKLTQFQPPRFCLTLNNLNYLDQTAANVTENKNFQPYLPLSDQAKALYFGFDRPLKGAPIKLYFAAKELLVDERNKPQLLWEFGFENDWKELLADDGTEAFTKPEFVSLNVPDGIQNTQEFGKALYWLRATLSKGGWEASPLFNGVFLNSVEAMQARTVRDEILGSSTGVEQQKFRLQQTPVIEGEEVRVREALTEEERDQLILAQGEDAVLAIRDQQDRVIETWIRWTEQLEFFDSDSQSRHYRLDRHTGEIEFGDGLHGRIPPAGGDNIRAFNYQAGGGAMGNVNSGEINTPVTAVAGVDSVINPVAAGGGSNAVTNDDMLIIGPAEISHRDRAVTPDDFERLALEASREVRKARCLPNRNASGRHELGWTTVHIVPDSNDPQPIPSLELRRSVERYLSARADVTIVDQKHVVIGPPAYVPVTVETTVFAKSLDLVASAEQRVKKELEQFLHPLSGGPDKEGWEFGRDLAASDLYSLLEAIDEVDHVGPVRLFSGVQAGGEQIEIGPDELIASGPHRIVMSVANGD